MSAAVSAEQVREASPRLTARMAGVAYLLSIVTGTFGVFFVYGTLVVADDAAATAANIVAHETLFRLAFASFCIGVACYVAVTALLYSLLRPVNRSLSVLAAFFSLVGCAMWAVGCIFQLAALTVLGGEKSLSTFTAAQVQALALTLLNLNGQALSMGIVFFGFYCLLLGYLIFRSTFLPRFVGVLLALAGVGYLTNLYPPLAHALSLYLQVPGLLGEGSLTLWLLVMGVDAQR
ncbi:MAG TPA: DUF4386 domain-containing protein, partial [Ktedonobacterales bacterium]|nr:DUF4386 domain-containing protein [Ktedonobacterales bacterium]